MPSTPPGAQQGRGVGTRGLSVLLLGRCPPWGRRCARSCRPARRSLPGRKEGPAASGSSRGGAVASGAPERAGSSWGNLAAFPRAPSTPALSVGPEYAPHVPLVSPHRPVPLPFQCFIGPQGPGRTAVLGESADAHPATGSSPRPHSWSAGSELQMLGRGMHCPAL